MAQLFPYSPEVVYEALANDVTFMSYIGTYTFTSSNTELPSITVCSPGANLPGLKRQEGIECIIHDIADIRRHDYLGELPDIVANWKVFLIAWEPATGLQLSNAVARAMQIFGGATSFETVATPDGLGSLVQTMLLIPGDSPVLITPPLFRITTQPEDLTVALGENVTFTVATDYEGAATVLYQWQENDGTGFYDLEGETSSTLEFVADYEYDYQYRCILSKSTGGVPLISDVATLTIT